MLFRKTFSTTRTSPPRFTFAASEFRNIKPLIWLFAMSVAGSTAIADNLYSPVAVYQPTLDRIAVFVNGNGGHLYDKYWNGQQWTWEDQGPPPGAQAGSQSVVYESRLDRIHVFVAADNGHLFERFWNGRQWVWDDWADPPGINWVFGPSAVDTANGISVSVIGSDGHLYELASPGFGTVWMDRGTPPGPYTRAYAPTSAIYQPSVDRTVVFVTGDNGHLYDEFSGGQWEDQGTPPGVNWVVNPSAVYQSALDRIVVFVNGYNDGHLCDKYWNGQEWVWEDQGTPPGGVKTNFPSAVYQSDVDRLVVFVIGNDGHLYDKYWDGRQWVWEDQGNP